MYKTAGVAIMDTQNELDVAIARAVLLFSGKVAFSRLIRLELRNLSGQFELPFCLYFRVTNSPTLHLICLQCKSLDCKGDQHHLGPQVGEGDFKGSGPSLH